MSAFNNLKDWLDKQKSSVEETITRYKNKEFMDAVVAGCALVAAADGTIDAGEKQKMAGYIERSAELKVFDMKDVIKSFNGYVDSFEFDYTIGKGEAMKAVAKLKGKDEASRLLVRVCSAIGMTDGDFDEKEKAIVREICQELGLPPGDFGL